MSKPLDATVLRAKASQAIQRPDSFQKSLNGTRKEHTQFSRALEALLTGLLLEPGAFFHLLSLQRNIILKDLADLSDDLEQVLVGLADSLEPSRAKSSTALATAEARLQSSLDRGIAADIQEVEGLRTALGGARTFARRALLPDLRGGGTGSTARARPEALLDVVEQLERLEKSLPRLHRRLSSFLAAGDEFSPTAIRTYLSPFMLQRTKDMLSRVSQAYDEGALGSAPQESLMTLLAPEAAVDALSGARHPSGYVVRGLPHHAGSSVIPAGSRLRIDPLPAGSVPAEVTGTQQPLSFPIGATLDLGGPWVNLVGAGLHFMYSKELADGSYNITVPQLLVRIAGVIRAVPLTVGSRTATQLVTEMNLTLGPLGVNASVRHDKVYLQGPTEMSLPASGLAGQKAELRTLDMVLPLVAFPLVIPGGNLLLAFDLLSSPAGIVTYSHDFGGGGAFADIAALITELESGGLAGTFDFSADGDQLVVTTKLVNIIYVLSLSNTSTALLLPLPPIPALPIPFLWDDVGRGSLMYTDSAVAEIGFEVGQTSTSYYSVEEAVMEVNETSPLDVLASAVGTSLYSGGAYIAAGIIYLEFSPAATIQPGDVVQAGSYGTYNVLSAVGAGYSVLQLDGEPPATGVAFEVEITRTVLKLVSTASDGSPMSLGNLSGHAPLGLPVDVDIAPLSSRFQILGTLAGETRDTAQDLRLLGVTEGCTIRLNNGGSSLIASVDSGGAYFDTVDALGEPGGTDFDILPAGHSGYKRTQAALRLLQRHDFYRLLIDAKATLRRAVEVLRAGTRSGATVSAAVDLARLLFLISTTHRTSVTSAIALRRLSASATVTGLSAEDVLLGYVAVPSSQAIEVAEAALSSFEEKGYDRAASLLLEGKYSDLLKLTADTASSTKKVSDSFRRVAAELPQSQRLGPVMESVRPVSKVRS